MIEIIPKPAAKLPLWQNILFYISIALLLAVFLSYFIFDHSLKTSLQTLENLEETLARGKTPAEISLEEETFGYQKKIGDFSKLIKGHLFASNFFAFFEKVSHPKVWFSQTDLNPQKGQVALLGEAENFSTLGQQILILKQEPLIKNLDLVSLSIGKRGRVDFTLNLLLDPKIFHE